MEFTSLEVGAVYLFLVVSVCLFCVDDLLFFGF